MKKHLISIIMITFLTGCALDEVIDKGGKCEGEVKMIWSAEDKVYTVDEHPEAYEYKDYFGKKYCPKNYTCIKKEDGEEYCHINCPAGQIVCDMKCVDPVNDMNHCGAMGGCYSDDPESDSFKGETCTNEQICRTKENGRIGCLCPDRWVSYIDDKGVSRCIHPSMDDHCGANNDNGDFYRGEECTGGQYCKKIDVDGKDTYACTCPDNHALCDGKCIHTSDIDHCGAKGKCLDDDMDSENYKGNTCKGGTICLNVDGNGNYQCVCESGFVWCGDKCVSSADNQTCGARGTCSSDDVDSPDFKGEICIPNQQLCLMDEDKKIYRCTCPNDFALCEDENGEKKCISPTDINHCGAKGLCNSDDPTSDNFKGNQCIREQQYCELNNDQYQCICYNKAVVFEETLVDENGEETDETQLVCINPAALDHCGAKGLTEDGNDSGDICGPFMTCQSIKNKTDDNEDEDEEETVDGTHFQCVCNEGYIMCPDRKTGEHVCINPTENIDYCGASGDAQDMSVCANSLGKQCKANQKCTRNIVSNQIDCADCDASSQCNVDNKVICVDFNTDVNHCGRCSNRCSPKKAFTKKDAVTSRCEKKVCCDIGRFDSDVSGGSIRCCSGTVKYYYQYSFWGGCWQHSHYGCYEEGKQPSKCWSRAD